MYLYHDIKVVVQMLPIRSYKELIVIYLKTQWKSDVNAIVQMQ